MTTPETDPLDGVPDDVVTAFAHGLGHLDVTDLRSGDYPELVEGLTAAYRAAVVGDELDDHEARLRAIPALSSLQRRSVDVVLANLTRLRRVEVAVLREVEQAQASELGVVPADVLQQLIARGGA